MQELLTKLEKSLARIFEQELKKKDIKYCNEIEIDVFRTFLTLNKNQNEFKALIEKSGISKDVLSYEFSTDLVEECINNKYIRSGTLINKNTYFIASNGLYHLSTIRNDNLYNLFFDIDNLKFPEKKLILKTQEKILCIFLIIFGKDSESDFLDLNIDFDKLQKYFNFLQIIENEMIIHSMKLGKEIVWGKGKDANFRTFITNNVDLPKTGIYQFKGSKYFLELGKRKNASILLDLILDQYDSNDRIVYNELFLQQLYNLSNQVLSEIGEMPKKINENIVSILKS